MKTMLHIKADVCKSMFQVFYLSFNGAALVMKYECKQIERRMRLVCAEIARFINEYTEFAHHLHFFQRKWRGTSPPQVDPGPKTSPLPSFVLYHNSEKNAIPFIEKIFHFPGGIFSHNQYMHKQGIYTPATIRNYVLISTMSYTVRKNEYLTVILCPCDILL